MKPYLIALVVGLLIGGIYSLLGVRSPAPPAVALIGLLGILLGEQTVPVIRRALAGNVVAPKTGNARVRGRSAAPSSGAAPRQRVS